MVLSRKQIMSAAAVAVMTLVGCGSADGSDTGGAPDLVATTSVWADITSQVACGEQVASVIPSGADPHTYEPSLRDRQLLEQAELVVTNGTALEAGMDELLAAADANVVEIAPHVDLIIPDDHDNEAHDDEAHDDDDDKAHDDGHGHAEGGDPHFWLDPTRVAGALDVIATAMADRDPATIRECVDAYRDELLALDVELADQLDEVPADRRLLVTNHESLTYFADRYDFDVLGTVLPGTSTLAETNPAQLEQLAELMRQRNVTAIFVEATEADAEAQALADRIGATVVPILTASLATEGPASTYVGMLRANATAIAEALNP